MQVLTHYPTRLCRTILVLLSWLACLILTAQNNVELDDLDPSVIEVRSYASPGIKNKSRSRGLDISYQILPRYSLRPEGLDPIGIIEHSTFSAKLRFPLLDVERLQVLGGFKYVLDEYELDKNIRQLSDDLGDLQEKNFKKTQFDLTGVYAASDRHYIGLNLKWGAHGDYEGFFDTDDRYEILRATAVYGIKKTENKEVGLGLYYSKSFRNSIILPILIYNCNLGPKTGIEAALPASIMFRYNINSKSIMLLGPEFQSSSYSANFISDSDQQRSYNINDSQIVIKAALERQVVSWLWFDLEIGYRIARNFILEPIMDNPNDVAASPQTNSFYLKTSIFLSPPDDFRAKRDAVE